MTIYVSHSTNFDYKNELYAPLAGIVGHTFVFPHNDSAAIVDSKSSIEGADLVLAEVSFPSTGQGIELGWANAAGKRIVCIHRADAKPSASLNIICKEFYPYADSLELAETVTKFL